MSVCVSKSPELNLLYRNKAGGVSLVLLEKGYPIETVVDPCSTAAYKSIPFKNKL